MGRGRSKFGGVALGGGVTAAQTKAAMQIARKTRDLKNEQYRIISENGEIIGVSKGDKHSVAMTLGEKRDKLPGAITIHNHPEGGTFSTADLSEFGLGARQIVVASPEGTYKLTNQRYGTKQQSAGWYDMRADMERAGLNRERSSLELRRAAQNTPEAKKLSGQMSKISEKWVAGRKSGMPQKQQDKLMEQFNKKSDDYKKLVNKVERELEVKPFHDYYRKNAGKYGFKYEFIKR